MQWRFILLAGLCIFGFVVFLCCRCVIGNTCGTLLTICNPVVNGTDFNLSGGSFGIYQTNHTADQFFRIG